MAQVQNSIMAKPKPAPLPADSTVGDYRVVRALASGGSSIVYLAASADGQAVLLKEYLPGALVHRLPGDRMPLVRPGRLERMRIGLHGFLDGARVLAQMQHPALASVLDCVSAHETVYLVLRHLQGRTLQEAVVAARLRTNAAQAGGTPRACLSEATILGLALDLLNAISVVHEAGLLHLDIKPANLLITPQGQLVLLDFDAVQPIPGHESVAVMASRDERSRPSAAGNTSTYTPAYTPGFSAPETLANAASLTPRTDLYAVGACLYACLLGHPPTHCLARTQDDPIPASLKALQSVYSAGLLHVVESALSIAPSQRPSSATAMADLLASAAQSAALSVARPAGPTLHERPDDPSSRLHPH